MLKEEAHLFASSFCFFTAYCKISHKNHTKGLDLNDGILYNVSWNNKCSFFTALIKFY